MIYVVGIGPGSPADLTQGACEALSKSDAVVGYKPYFQYVDSLIPQRARRISTGMRHERERIEEAFALAEEGLTVSVISSGDAGIYGMASLVMEVKREREALGETAVREGSGGVEVVVVPGISAFQKAAALLGAPMGHDFCVLSLSDILTPWPLIERRITAAAEADFVTAVYNPRSQARHWQLPRLRELFLQHRSPSTPVGYVRQAGRSGQRVVLTTLEAFRPEDVDMFTIVIIGNSQTFPWQGRLVTPRGYPRSLPPVSKTEGDEAHDPSTPTPGGTAGQRIMQASFATIMGELRQSDLPLWRLWPLLHAVHTTADFEMESLLYTTPRAVEELYQRVSKGEVEAIVTDVSMVASGIRKAALRRLGDIPTVCNINLPEAALLAREQGLTRAQAGIRIAARTHPHALYAIGNAPTALLELCALVREGVCRPAGIVAAPVGFVHVVESKQAVKELVDIPLLVIEGRKGGSGIAATLVNSILTYDDAASLRPGRDV